MRPLPCPFCGEQGPLDVHEGSTFRWMLAECAYCGAQGPEIRIDTLSKNRDEAIAKGRTDAIYAWNTRTTTTYKDLAEPIAWLVTFENGETEFHFKDTLGSLGESQEALYTADQVREILKLVAKIGDGFDYGDINCGDLIRALKEQVK